MNNASYITLTRQTGLMREMQVAAHNIANISTTGFRREGVIFSEHVRALDRGEASLSMALAHGRSISSEQGALVHTGGRFDAAIEGIGYFLIETATGERITRAGAFTPNEAGELVNLQGDRVLDAGGAPIFIPPDAVDIALARDGTLSANGLPVAQIAVVQPVNAAALVRESDVTFHAADGVEPVPETQLLQGYLENSNVEPVAEIARTIEVQRAYEIGQHLLDREDERIRTVIQTLGR